MRYAELCSRIAKAEGKKHQASVADVREIISLLARHIVANQQVTDCFLSLIRQAAKEKPPRKVKPSSPTKKK